ncbi:MAG: SEC-C metal-binding domain-containing protein, partial [Candidatus Cloacimonadales bacterium]
MAKIGRNEPCPCGSGKKYKKCCLNKNQELSTEFIFRKSREIDLEIIDKLRHFVGQHFGPEIIHLAWQDFSGDSKAFFSEDNPHHQLFLPWTLFNWLPAQNDEFDPSQRKYDFTIADFFLEKYSTQLSSLERIYIEQTIKQP